MSRRRDPSDVAWFSHGKYLSLVPGAGTKIVASERIMLSPVILGVKKSVADRFGWGSGPKVTLKDIAARAGPGRYVAQVVGDRPTLEKLSDGATA